MKNKSNDFLSCKTTRHAVKTFLTGKLFPKLNDSVSQAVKHLNSLDVELYTFAKKLFLKRVKNFKESESRT